MCDVATETRRSAETASQCSGPDTYSTTKPTSLSEQLHRRLASSLPVGLRSNRSLPSSLACPSKDDLREISRHRTDRVELEMVQELRAYYLIRGVIIQVVQEDAASGMSEIHLPRGFKTLGSLLPRIVLEHLRFTPSPVPAQRFLR